MSNATIEEKRAAIAANPASSFPTGKYQIIIIDPPWKYGLRDKDPSHRNRTPYPTMEIEDIFRLPVWQIASDPCYIWLWATKDYLEDAFRALSYWGFDYKNIFTWVKVVKDGDKIRIGTGHWGRNCTEFLLLGATKKAKCLSHLGLTNCPTAFTTEHSSAFFEQRGKHSQKPEIIYEMCDRLAASLGDARKIELFARSARDGWDCWGNEV